MKRLYSFILLLVLTGAWLHAESLCLTLNFANGEVAKFAIPESPVMTFDGEELVVKTSLNVEGRYKRDLIKSFDFTMGETASVENLTGDSDYMVDFTNGQQIVISGKNVTSATAYDAAGREAVSAKAVSGSVTLDLRKLEPGIYIISIPGHRTLKIKK